jgi:hypothetical protein
MSQRMDALNLIEKAAGVRGLLLRPLTAKNMEPTKPELEGIVDRERLLDIRGRSRKPQMALAKEFGITEYPNPAGGCLLTDPEFAKRVKDAMKHDEFNAGNLAILSVGRHFRISERSRLVVGRDEEENTILESLGIPGDIIFELLDHEGPTSVLRGDTSKDIIKLAADITSYHTKFRAEGQLRIGYHNVGTPGSENILADVPEKDTIESLRIN